MGGMSIIVSISFLHLVLLAREIWPKLRVKKMTFMTSCCPPPTFEAKNYSTNSRHGPDKCATLSLSRVSTYIGSRVVKKLTAHISLW